MKDTHGSFKRTLLAFDKYTIAIGKKEWHCQCKMATYPWWIIKKKKGFPPKLTNNSDNWEEDSVNCGWF